MPKRFDLLIFDWDGTLADSTVAIVDALRYASHDLNLPTPSDQASRDIIGLELFTALKVLFGELDASLMQDVAERYKHHYNVFSPEIKLFDGVKTALPALADDGFILAVASGKGKNGLLRAIEQANFTRLMLATRSADDCFSKPHPQMLQEIMDELGATPERTLMIGDTTFDLQMAQNAGVSSLAVSYGAQSEQALIPHSPLACFDNFATLHAWLRANA
jgi:phosphoglycolate phosphatase